MKRSRLAALTAVAGVCLVVGCASNGTRQPLFSRLSQPCCPAPIEAVDVGVGYPLMSGGPILDAPGGCLDSGSCQAPAPLPPTTMIPGSPPTMMPGAAGPLPLVPQEEAPNLAPAPRLIPQPQAQPTPADPASQSRSARK